METIPLQPIRSLSLLERRRLALPMGRDVTEAARLLDWWERTYFKGQPVLFSRRLRSDGLDRRTVLPLLAAADGPAAVQPRPLAMLDRVGSRPVSDDPVAAGFEPFVGSAWDRVEQGVDALESASPGLAVDRAGIEAQFRDYLEQRLFDLAVRVFIVRLHVARLRGLAGETPEARFQAWARAEWADEEARARLLEEFPVLARSLATAASGAASAWAEMLDRLATDWPVLRGEPDRLVGVRSGLGDTHNGGRTVMRVTFASGTQFFYKPRPMAVDAHTQDLIRWLNDHGLEPALRTVAVVDRGDHGWMEAVTPAPCVTGDDVTAFYRRQGALLLVLYLLDGSDIHSENVVAAGPHPVLVDLEMMFQAPVAGDDHVVSRTVLQTKLLPGRSGSGIGLLDGGGLSDLAGQESPAIVLLTGVGTDGMRVERQQVALDGHDNVPRLDGYAVQAAGHVDDIAAGFADAYRVVARHRDSLLAAGGPIRAFGTDRVRHIVRGTDEYALLLRASYHPACLRDAVRREFVFDPLWLETARRPYLERMIASERDDLLDGDVPYFTASVDSCDLLDSRGQAIEGLLATSGLDRVLDRVANMDEGDLRRQVACVRGSFAAIATAAPAAKVPAVVEPAPEATPEELVAAATAIGERLADLAFRREGEADWTGLLPRVDRGFDYTAIGPDLYDGTAGVALFLAYLARATGRGDFADLARAAYAGAARRYLGPDGDRSIGAFNGASGLLYAALHLADVVGEPVLIADAVAGLLGGISRQVPKDRRFDVIGGAAGCILVLLRLAERHPPTEAMAVARACGRHLVRNAVEVDGGLGWRSGSDGGRPLLGLAHGASGIAAALAQLAVVAPDARFSRAARRALDYERSHFAPAVGNWPDFRRCDRPDGFGWAWCYGAPGVGLARLMTPLDDARADVAPALTSTEAHGFGGIHTLCHGDLGNAELLLMTGDHRGALRRAGAVLQHHRRTAHWLCGLPGGEEPPSLMTGVAGIGYQLLRLADPAGVPSVLTLEGPRPE